MPFDAQAFIARLEAMVQGLPQDATAERLISEVTGLVQETGSTVAVALPTGSIPPVVVQAALSNEGDILHRIESFETIYTIAHDAYGDSGPASVAKITQDPRNSGVAIDWDTLPTGQRLWIPA